MWDFLPVLVFKLNEKKNDLACFFFAFGFLLNNWQYFNKNSIHWSVYIFGYVHLYVRNEIEYNIYLSIFLS